MLMLILGQAACGDAPGKAADEAQDKGGSFAVVELFTSEGCSSCPPADALLAEIVKDAREHGRRIYPLAFHVDYWDRLGWRDPFADAAYSQRQQAYARAMRTEEIYTPQMIVNGSAAFVGSDRARSGKEIERAMGKSAGVKLTVTVKTGDKASVLVVEYSLSKTPANALLNVAVVERGLHSDVQRGENQGRSLRHDNVVRAFQTMNITTEKGKIELKVPASVQAKNASIIAYVQDRSSMGVLVAEGAEMPVTPADK